MGQQESNQGWRLLSELLFKVSKKKPANLSVFYLKKKSSLCSGNCGYDCSQC